LDPSRADIVQDEKDPANTENDSEGIVAKNPKLDDVTDSEDPEEQQATDG